MRPVTPRAVILKAIVFTVFVLACASPVTPPLGPSSIAMAQSSTDFTLKDTEGRQYTLSQFRGKVVLVNFVTYLCQPCKQEMPYLNQLDQEFKGQGFQVIGIGLDSTADQLRNMAQQAGVSYPMLVGTDAVAKAYGNIEFVPTSFIIDRQGNIVQRLNWPQSQADIAKAVKSAL